METVHKTIKSLKLGVQSAKEMTLSEVLGMMLGVCLVTFGNAGQLLAVNEWLTLFPAEASAPFTVLTITATSTTIFFTTCFFIWCAVKRPRVNYLWTRDCWLLAILIGFGNAGNGVLIVSATGFTPEILQAFLFSTTIFWTFILMKIANKDSRSYFSPLVVISFLFSLGGIVVGSASQFGGDSSGGSADCGHTFNQTVVIEGHNVTVPITQSPCTPPNPKWWIAVFSAGMLMVSIYNVFVYRFMSKYSSVKGRVLSGVATVSGRGSFGGTDDVQQQGGGSFARNTSFVRKQLTQRDFDEAITLKLAMLFATGITQTVWMWTFTMLDAVPNFGSSPSLPATYSRIAVGYRCVFDASYLNNSNGLYAFLFAFCYVLNYFGTAYLNSYSAAVTSMVTQLSSPVVALILLIIPKWNVSAQPVSIPESLVAILCLIIGAFLYTAWEESTRQEQEENLIASQSIFGKEEGGAGSDEDTEESRLVA